MLELSAAKGAVRAIRLFGDEVRKLDARMRGSAPGVNTTVIQEVQEHPCLLLGFLLTSVCMVLVDNIQSLKLSPSPTPESATEMRSSENDLRLCIATIEHTASSFPLLAIQSKKIKDYQDRSNRALASRQAPRWEFERRAGLDDDIY